MFYFANGGNGAGDSVLIGSADWMLRNLDRRVEVVAPILDPDLKEYLKEELLGSYLRDTVNANVLNPDGSYARPAAHGEEPFDAQMHFAGMDINH